MKEPVLYLKALCLPSKSSVWRNQCCTPESSMLAILVIRMEEPVLYPWKLYVYHLSHPYGGARVVSESSMLTILVIRMEEPVLYPWKLDAYHLSHPYGGTSVVPLKARCLPSKSSVWRNQCCTPESSMLTILVIRMEEPVLYPWNLDAYHLSHPYGGTSVVPLKALRLPS